MFEPTSDNKMNMSKTIKEKEKKPYKPSDKEIFIGIGIKGSVHKKTRKQ
jgi:hypothetical protein